MIQVNVASMAHNLVNIVVGCRRWLSSWECNDCIYSKKNKEIIYDHKLLRVIVYKDMKN